MYTTIYNRGYNLKELVLFNKKVFLLLSEEEKVCKLLKVMCCVNRCFKVLVKTAKDEGSDEDCFSDR